MLLEELDHFEKSDMPKGRPNTMNNYGVSIIYIYIILIYIPAGCSLSLASSIIMKNVIVCMISYH